MNPIPFKTKRFQLSTYLSLSWHFAEVDEVKIKKLFDFLIVHIHLYVFSPFPVNFHGLNLSLKTTCSNYNFQGKIQPIINIKHNLCLSCLNHERKLIFSTTSRGRIQSSIFTRTKFIIPSFPVQVYINCTIKQHRQSRVALHSHRMAVVEDIFCSFIIIFIFVVPRLHKHLGTG